MATSVDSNKTNNTRTTLEPASMTTMTLELTTIETEYIFDIRKRLVTAFVAFIVYLVVVGTVTLGCWLYKRCGRDRAKRIGGLSIAEYCNRSYNSASNIDDAIFSVHFSSATGDVHLPTPLNADDLQRLDADFNVVEEDDICPYATFTEIEQLQAARRWGTDPPTAAGDLRTSRTADNNAALERRRKRPRRTDRVDENHQQPQRQANNNNQTAIYAQPHKLRPITKDSASLTNDNQHVGL